MRSDFGRPRGPELRTGAKIGEEGLGGELGSERHELGLYTPRVRVGSLGKEAPRELNVTKMIRKGFPGRKSETSKIY